MKKTTLILLFSARTKGGCSNPSMQLLTAFFFLVPMTSSHGGKGITGPHKTKQPTIFLLTLWDNLELLINIHVVSLWEKTGVLGEKPCVNEKNIQTLQRQSPGQDAILRLSGQLPKWLNWTDLSKMSIKRWVKMWNMLNKIKSTATPVLNVRLSPGPTHIC